MMDIDAIEALLDKIDGQLPVSAVNGEECYRLELTRGERKLLADVVSNALEHRIGSL